MAWEVVRSSIQELARQSGNGTSSSRRAGLITSRCPFNQFLHSSIPRASLIFCVLLWAGGLVSNLQPQLHSSLLFTSFSACYPNKNTSHLAGPLHCCCHSGFVHWLQTLGKLIPSTLQNQIPRAPFPALPPTPHSLAALHPTSLLAKEPPSFLLLCSKSISLG